MTEVDPAIHQAQQQERDRVIAFLRRWAQVSSRSGAPYEVTVTLETAAELLESTAYQRLWHPRDEPPPD